MIDIEGLLEFSPSPVKYPTWEDELRAVASHEKGMSAVSFAKDDITGQSEQYESYIRLAQELGLIVVHRADVYASQYQREFMHVFATTNEQQWRVPALLVLMDALHEYEWSDSSEYAFSSILGYSADSVKSWISLNRRIRYGWRGSTMYFLMTSPQYSAVQTLGGRFPYEVTGDLIVFCSYRKQVPRHDAAALVPSNQVLCRASVPKETLVELFGARAGRDVVFRRVEGQTLVAMNQKLESPIQHFVEGQWQR